MTHAMLSASIYLLHIFFCIILELNQIMFSLPWHKNAGGKPITPSDVTDSSLSNGHTTENGAVAETVTKTEVSIDWHCAFH